MADQYVQLVSDASNTGKKVRTNERVVGSNTVQEHFNILQDRISDVQAAVLTVSPSGAEGGLVVRNVPNATQSGSTATLILYPIAFEDAAGLSQMARVNAYGNVRTAEQGNRNINGSYRHSVSPLTGSTNSPQLLMTLTNPTGSTVNVYLKHVTISPSVNAVISVPASGNWFYHIGRANAPPPGTGTTQAYQKMRTSNPAGQALIHTGISSVTASAGNLWTGGGPTWLSGTTSFSGFNQLEAFTENRDTDDVILAAGEAVVIWAGPNNVSTFHGITISWDEGNDLS
jgi:hypothetical protein